MGLVNRRQVFQTNHPMRLKAPLVLVELGPRHASLPAGLGDVPQTLGQFQQAQPLLGYLGLGIHHLLPPVDALC